MGIPLKKMGLSIFALKDGISWGSAWGYHGSTANPMNIDPRELFLPGYTKSLDSFERFNDSCWIPGVSPNTTSRDKSSNKRGYIIAFFRNMCIPEFDGLSSCSWKKNMTVWLPIFRPRSFCLILSNNQLASLRLIDQSCLVTGGFNSSLLSVREIMQSPTWYWHVFSKPAVFRRFHDIICGSSFCLFRMYIILISCLWRA